MEKKQFNIGETFQCGLLKLKCIENDSKNYRCDSCFFTTLGRCLGKEIVGHCVDSFRNDKTDVIFVKVEDE